MLDHIATRAKAYAALVGSVATALLGIYSTGDLGKTLTIVVAIATAVTTYVVPNADDGSGDAGNPGEDGVLEMGFVIGLLFAVFLVLGILWFLGVHVHVR